LISDLKLFLLVNPDLTEALQSAFRGESFRIPVLDYSSVVRERTSLERLLKYALRRRRWWRTENPTIETLIRRARRLRKSYEDEFYGLLQGAGELRLYQRKRRVPKLRYCAGRLIYLASPASLRELGLAADALPELRLHSLVMVAVGSGRIDDLLPLGTNAAQAAAQPLLAAGQPCTVQINVEPDTVEDRALAIFLFNGVHVAQPDPSSRAQSEIGRFAASGSDPHLMRSGAPFIREIACLHGLSQGPRHAEMLRTAFDEDEHLAWDAIEQFQPSASY
jgi:hypothetical protein